MTNLNTSNPLLSVSTLKNRAVPFHEIKNEHYLPAVKEAIQQAQRQLEKVVDHSESANFENTIEALENLSEPLDYVATIFYKLLSAHSNEEMQKLAGEIGPLLSQFSNDVTLNPELFKRVQSVYDQKAQLTLSTEQATLLENTYKDFQRNGALLDADKKQTLREIDKRLSELTPKFAENLLKATNSFEMLLTDPSDVTGLPESALESAEHAAKEKGHEKGWLFTLDIPSYLAFMKYADHRELREKLYKAYASRSFGGEFDNQKVLKEIAKLRFQRAQLLGYPTHAHFILEKRMAETPEKVHKFLDRIAEVSLPAAQKDITELQEFVNSQQGPSTLQRWDFSYYSEKLKEQKYHFNEEEIRPYFKLENVIAGAFEHARRLYGIRFEKSSDYPTYHGEVTTYDVYSEETNEFIGVFFADFFPRSSKRGGAWMTNIYRQGLFMGEVMRPHVVIVCNFTKSTPTKPSLLTYDEVRTLFHEFGHALHGLLSKCHYRSLSGTSVYWDFVELPSQVMENWTLEHETLSLFAKHYQTNEVIPKELTQKLKNSSLFQAGYTSLRQVSLGKLDFAWHALDPSGVDDVPAYESQVMTPFNAVPEVPGTNLSCNFSHIFAGGYSAGYYSYKWAEVLDADTFELFKEKGLYNKEVATSFKKNILEKGGSEHPMELYKRFRGREPDPDALLRRDQFI